MGEANGVNALLQTLRNLGPVRLAAIGGVGVMMIAFFIFLMMRMGSPAMGLLYSDLNAQDSGAIDKRLEALNIPHDVRGEGAQVWVPVEEVPKTRVMLAAEGLPTGGSIGYEIFDKTQGLATSSFVQNINQLRALEGEINRTIQGIEGIKTARVHLVLPTRELFTRERQTPSAAIMLTMKGPQRLDKAQVVAIQHLVAAAVPGLKPELVSIVDERGTLLAKGTESSPGTIDLASADEVRASLENRVAREVESLLERTLGYGKVRTVVTAELDMARTTQNEELFNPEQQVPRSTQTVNDLSERKESDGSSSVTIANNLPQGANQGGTSGVNSERTSRTEETTNYEIGRTVRNRVNDPGQLKRLSVSALVDGTYTTAEDGTRTYVPRAKAELDQIEGLVKTAIGFDAQRGDQVDVVNMRFAAEDEAAPAPKIFGLERQELFRLAEILMLGAVGALVLLLVVRPLLSRLFEVVPTTATAGAAAAMLGGMPGAPQLTGPGGAMGGELAIGMDGEDSLDDMIDLNRIEGRVKASSLRKIGEIVEKHPEDVVAIIRNWLYQEHSN